MLQQLPVAFGQLVTYIKHGIRTAVLVSLRYLSVRVKSNSPSGTYLSNFVRCDPTPLKSQEGECATQCRKFVYIRLLPVPVSWVDASLPGTGPFLARSHGPFLGREGLHVIQSPRLALESPRTMVHRNTCHIFYLGSGASVPVSSARCP